jgi:hypothetical protein
MLLHAVMWCAALQLAGPLLSTITSRLHACRASMPLSQQVSVLSAQLYTLHRLHEERIGAGSSCGQVLLFNIDIEQQHPTLNMSNVQQST